MIYISFFLKFKAQLRRTRPDIVRLLDESFSRSILDAGGKITGSRLIINAVFNEDVIGFWLDIYILIENLINQIESSGDFFNYSLVISSDSGESTDLLCRFLSSGNGGIFMDAAVVKKFLAYAAFEKPSEWLKERMTRKYSSGNFYRVKNLKTFKPHININPQLQKETFMYLQDVLSEEKLQNKSGLDELNNGKNVLIIGNENTFIRSSVYDFCKMINGDFPPLVFCFGSIGLGALVDAWSFNIRSLGSLFSGNETDMIDNLWELLFRERLRDEISDFVIRSVKKYLSLLYDYYFSAAKNYLNSQRNRGKIKTPVIILENIHLAGRNITELFIESLSVIKGEYRQKLIILAIAQQEQRTEDEIHEDKLSQWKDTFGSVKKINSTDNKRNVPHLSLELWEIVYAIALLSKYFSPELFQKLFEEDERNPVMISKAFSILHLLGVITNPRHPWLLERRLEERAARILGDTAIRVRAFVRARLLNWAERKNLTSSFRLLSIVAGLDMQSNIKVSDDASRIDDLMLLKSILTDIVNQTISGFEAALQNGQIEEIAGCKRADVIRCIYYTSKALYSGKEDDIDKIFNKIFSGKYDPAFEFFPVMKAQIITNLCGFFLGRYNINDASAKAKEAIMLSQKNNAFCLPQVYRLFSLVCLSKKQITETIEYLNFALTNAEKSGNYFEMAICAYYASAAKFLYGDIFNALRLAQKSIEYSLTAGCAQWADRSRFLEGRLKFELGYYCEAGTIFSSIRNDPCSYITNDKDSVLAAWIYRCSIYSGDMNVIKPESAKVDGDLFEIEAAYLCGDYKKAVSLSASFKIPFSKEDFLYTECPNWSSGYAQCEHLYFSEGEIHDRMVRLFHSLSLSNLTDKSREELMAEIQQLLRDERLCEMDPNDAFYYFAKYLIMEKTGASAVDMSTAVSMAFKRLQRRAGHIEDVDTRFQYLNGPRWNSRLSAAAKEFKLI